MQGGKGEKQRYAEDKPDCAYCYFRKKKGVCGLEKCYYLLPEEPEKEEGVGRRIEGDANDELFFQPLSN